MIYCLVGSEFRGKLKEILHINSSIVEAPTWKGPISISGVYLRCHERSSKVVEGGGGGGNQPKLDEEEEEGTTTTRIGENSELFSRFGESAENLDPRRSSSSPACCCSMTEEQHGKHSNGIVKDE